MNLPEESLKNISQFQKYLNDEIQKEKKFLENEKLGKIINEFNSYERKKSDILSINKYFEKCINNENIPELINQIK